MIQASKLLLVLALAAGLCSMDSANLTRSDFEAYYAHVVPDAIGTGDERRARCPIHNGSSNTSFHIDLSTGRWYCHSQCGRGGDVFGLQMALHGYDYPQAFRAVYDIIGRTPPPYQPPTSNPLTAYRQKLYPWRTTATYVYRDEAGQPLYRAVRKEKAPVNGEKPEKKFTLETPRDGGWNSANGNMDGIRRVPYRLPELLAAKEAGQTIWLVEGEKAAEAVIALGLVGTCNPQGAGKWNKYRHDLNPPFIGARVVILPDNDDAGRKHALSVADNLMSIAAAIAIVELPDLCDKGDIVDWLSTGGTKDELVKLASATPQLDQALFAAYKRQWGAPTPKASAKAARHKPPVSVSDGDPTEEAAAGALAESQAHAQVRKELSYRLQAQFIAFVQIGFETPTFRLETSKGSIRFDDTGQVVSQREFRKRTSPVLNHSIAHHKDTEWPEFLNLLWFMKTTEEADPETQPTGSMLIWLDEYLRWSQSQCHKSWEDALKADPENRRQPHFEGDRICISADHARNYCAKHRNELISYVRLAEVLHDLGAERVSKFTRSPKTNITFYRLPETFHRRDYQIIETLPAEDTQAESIDTSYTV